MVAVPFLFAPQGGNVNASELDADFAALGNAINVGSVATLSSGSTVAIGASGAAYIFITGGNTINAFDTIASGTIRFLEFAASLTLTNSASLICPGGQNIVVNAGDVYVFISEGSGVWRCGPFRVANAPPVFRGALEGLVLSNDATTPNTVFDIAAGFAADSTVGTYINLSVAFNKSISGAWAAGIGGNGMGTGVTFSSTGGVTAGPWFPVFAINNAGLADVYVDNSVTAANKPSGTTVFRRIGYLKSDGSSHIIAFIQDGDFVQWKTPTNDVASTNPGTAAVLQTMNTPLGINTIWVGAAQIAGAGTTSLGLFTDPAVNDTAATNGNSQVNQIGGAANVGSSYLQVRTNLLSQIRSRISFSDAGTTLNTTSIGYIDRRGRDG